MRNLKLLKALNYAFASPTSCRMFCVDSQHARIFLAYDFGILESSSCNGATISNTDLHGLGYAKSEEGNGIIDLAFLADQLLCIATTIGDILTYDPVLQVVSGVGVIESGTKAMSWSPDCEIVVFVTGGGTILLMNRDFDPVTEVDCNPSGFGQDEFITVGWGKKETQFHGTAGKQAAIQNAQVVSELLPWDDCTTRVSWRGDGQFFAVSLLTKDADKRVIRIWSRDGVHSTTMEEVSGIGQSLCWKPLGGLIASSRWTESENQIVFFEKNGLRHGEFMLPKSFQNWQVKELHWNGDSSILLVWAVAPSDTAVELRGAQKSFLQLWVVGNYHWYLKQELVFGELESVRFVQWDTESLYKLHVLLENNNYLQYTYSWSTDCLPHDSTVAVIDGDKLLLSAFSKAVVPPPMTSYVLQFSHAVNCVFWCAYVCSDMRLAVLLSNGDLCICGLVEGNSVASCKAENWAKFVVQQNFKISDRVVNLQFISPSDVLGLSFKDGNQYTNLYHFSEDSANCISCIVTKQLTGAVSGVDSNVPILLLKGGYRRNEAVAELENGTLLRCLLDSAGMLTLQSHLNIHHLQVTLPNACEQVEELDVLKQDVFVSLSSFNRLFINDLPFATNITSMAIHNEYLLVTTLDSFLYCLPFTELLDRVSSLKLSDFSKNHARACERGSRLVCCVSDDTKVILQMPRGNLECNIVIKTYL